MPVLKSVVVGKKQARSSVINNLEAIARGKPLFFWLTACDLRTF